MKLPFPFLTKRARPPYCPLHRCVNGCPKTLSFRAENETISELVTFTENDPTWSYHHVDEHPSPLSSSSSSSSSSEQYEDDHVEDVVRGLRSERLVFEPGEAKSSKLLEERVEMETMVSSNPFEDFRRSMEEMVEGHEGLHQDWEFLEELLACYLRINGRDNHGYIVGAFVDLLVHLNNAIYKLFHDNKHARAMQLEHRFRTTVKGTKIINEYCHTLKNLADYLDDVDAPVTEHALVLQVLQGLPHDIRGQVHFLQFQNLFPSFLEVRSALLLVEHQQADALPNAGQSTALLSFSAGGGSNTAGGGQLRQGSRGRTPGVAVSADQIGAILVATAGVAVDVDEAARISDNLAQIPDSSPLPHPAF
ncbi:unnamed protein product [Cuscuta campestris]|uniref:OVATE domain-containing protein n=1 Tax=Cuscuta campestris TaxID=132261 RepID=A0A484LA25_9ASTE|nr:unnamed protein product [Cuscuta campestris]